MLPSTAPKTIRRIFELTPWNRARILPKIANFEIVFEYLSHSDNSSVVRFLNDYSSVSRESWQSKKQKQIFRSMYNERAKHIEMTENSLLPVFSGGPESTLVIFHWNQSTFTSSFQFLRLRPCLIRLFTLTWQIPTLWTIHSSALHWFPARNLPRQLLSAPRFAML